MEIRTGTRPARWRPLLLYVPLFLVPAAGVFVLVLMQFQGLPPQFESTLVFRLDPHFGRLAEVREDSPDSRPMLDPQAVTREIKSRYRMREAVKGLDIFKERSEEKQELFLDQTIQALSVSLKREFGQHDTYLVTVKLTRATHDPAPFEELLKRIRKVYLDYNVDRLIEQQAKDKASLDSGLAQYENDYRKALDALNDFRKNDVNKQFIPASASEQPLITTELKKIRDRLNELGDKKDKDSVDLAKELTERLRTLNEENKRAPAVLRQYSILREQVSDQEDQRDDVLRQHSLCAEALAALRSKRDERFAIVPVVNEQPVFSRSVESEQTSRLFIGAAAGIVAGLLMVLFALVIAILGKRGE